MSEAVTIEVCPNPTGETEQAVQVSIPHELIALARTYGAIDWNDVMDRAVKSIPPNGLLATVKSVDTDDSLTAIRAHEHGTFVGARCCFFSADANRRNPAASMICEAYEEGDTVTLRFDWLPLNLREGDRIYLEGHEPPVDRTNNNGAEVFLRN